jgi:hypothetical protein
MASSVLKSSSNPRCLICSKSAVAIFICVSSVAFLAVSSGNCVMAVFKCAAFVTRSLSTPKRISLVSFTEPHKETRNSQLRNIVNVADTRTPSDLSGVLLILIELDINLLCHLWEGVGCVSRPEEIFGVEVVGTLLGLGDDDAVELDFKAVGD